MRQAGVIAAPGIVALKTMVPRLAEDHRHARVLGERLAAVPGLRVDLETVQTNMVNVDVGGLGIDAATFAGHLDALGVRGLPGLGTIVRFVTYRGITEADVLMAAEAVEMIAAARPWGAASAAV
jgi:threonine aldolase